MDRAINEVKTVYAGSDADEEFLLADIEIGGVSCCQVLKREGSGPVMLAFFRPDSREEVLVDVDSFVAAV
jgi:hypothetical protein